MLGIVILNYNTWMETMSCINSVKKYVKLIDYKIYVIDNKSIVKPSEKEMKYLKSMEMVELIFSKENKGYSAGNNIGIKYALDDGCTTILICNSDILFVDNSLEIMQSYLEKNKMVGIVGPQIYNSKNEFQPFYMLSKLTGIGKFKNMFLKTPLKFLLRNFEKNFIRKNTLEVPMKVFGVSGCCFLMSKKCAEFLYPLDENTFLYEEEYIIGSILEKSDFEVHIIPNTHVIHVHGVSTKGISEFSYNCLIESEQYYLKEYLHTNIVFRKILFLIRKILKRRHVSE